GALRSALPQGPGSRSDMRPRSRSGVHAPDLLCRRHPGWSEPGSPCRVFPLAAAGSISLPESRAKDVPGQGEETMVPGKYGRIGGLMLHVLLGGLMVFAGVMKLAGMMPPEATQKMPAGIADHLKLIGAGELATAILLIAPITSSLGVLLASGFWGG